jgi:DNA polymerase-3 subunit epsilon
MNWPWQKPKAPLVEAYLAATPRRVPKKTPLAEITFVVLDAETTGFDLQRDRILSLALVEVSGLRLRVPSAESWTVFQPHATVNQAVTVHGILPAQTALGRPEKEVLDELLPRLHGTIVTGHHIGFDKAMLNAAMQRHHKTTLRNPTLDTAALAMESLEAFARTAYPGQREPTLDEVCAQCDFAPVDRHTAEGDAFTTASLLLAMCARLRRRLDRPLCAGDLPLRDG